MFATRLNYRKTKRWTLLPNDQEMDEIHRHFDDDLYGEVEGVLDKELQKEHKDPDPFKTQEILSKFLGHVILTLVRRIKRRYFLSHSMNNFL